MIFKMCLHVHLLSFFFLLRHVLIQVAIYVLLNLYLILAVSHVSTSHPSFNSRGHYNIRLKGQGDQIDTFKKLRTKLTFNVKIRDQICSLPNFILIKLYFFIINHVLFIQKYFLIINVYQKMDIKNFKNKQKT